MQLKTGTFHGMAKYILDNNCRIVIFGAGVIGTTIVPELLRNHGIEHKVDFYVDNDSIRWESDIWLGNSCVKIHSPKCLEALNENAVVLVTVSRFDAVFEQLNAMPCTDNMTCFFVPMMCIDTFLKIDNKNNSLMVSDTQLIPKIIHYMWLGGKEMPDKLKRCIDSWYKYCPDYEIMRWDETNYDVHKNKFVADAYDNGRFGFVPDYARLELLYTYGGIYMDTDVELLRNIDELLHQEAFCGVEKWQVLNFGACSGAVKGHKSLEPFLENWEKRELLRRDGSIDNISSGQIDTNVALKFGYKIDGTSQNVNGMNIYSYDYFNPYDYMSGRIDKTMNTFSIHHFNNGWLTEKERENNRRTLDRYNELRRNAVEIG